MSGEDKFQKWMKGSTSFVGCGGTQAPELFLSSPGPSTRPGTRQTSSFSVIEVIYLLNFWISVPSNYQVLVIWAGGSP